MDHRERAKPRRALRPVRAATIAFFALVLVSGPALAACSDAHSDGSTAAAATTMPGMPAMAPALAPAARAAVWDARPDYVRENAQVEEAYAYALDHPEIVKWMPCYCGCEGMGHGSNRDCYFKHDLTGDKPVYEEHASYCDICVQITLKTKELVGQGMNLRAIRLVVDQTWGGSAPGTPTALPPV